MWNIAKARFQRQKSAPSSLAPPSSSSPSSSASSSAKATPTATPVPVPPPAIAPSPPRAKSVPADPQPSTRTPKYRCETPRPPTEDTRGLLDLESGLLIHIASYLDFTSAARLAGTCHALQDVGEAIIWNELHIGADHGLLGRLRAATHPNEAPKTTRSRRSKARRGALAKTPQAGQLGLNDDDTQPYRRVISAMRCFKALLDARPQRCLAVRTVRFDARCLAYDRLPPPTNETPEEQFTTAWMVDQGWHTTVNVRRRMPRSPNEPEPDPETHNELSAILADFPKLPAAKYLSMTLHEYGPSFLRAALCFTPHITSLKITNGRATLEKFILPKSPDWPTLSYLRDIKITLLPNNQPLVIALLGRYPQACRLDLVADLNYFDLPCNTAARQKILQSAAGLRSPYSHVVQITQSQMHLMEKRHPLFKSRMTHCPCPKFDEAFLDALSENDNLESLGLTGCLADAIRSRRKCGYNMKKLLDGEGNSAKRSDKEREGKWWARIQRHREEATHWQGNFYNLVDEDGHVGQ